MKVRYFIFLSILYFSLSAVNWAAATLLTTSFSTPPSGRVIAGSVLVSVTASPGVVGVQFKVDGQNLGNEITVAPFSVMWNTTLTSNSVHTLTAVARDAVGNQATATETITVDNTLAAAPPAGGLSVSFSTPPSGRVIAGSVLVSVTASPGIVGVQFKVDGQNLGNEITVAPFSVMWNTTLTSNSVHTLTAVARDAVGNQATATETITVDNTLAAAPPAGGLSVSFSTPPSGRVIAGSVLVSVTASPGIVGVQFRVDGQNLGNEITVAPFSVTWNTTLTSNSVHTLTAVARDAVGNQATATETITVDNTLAAAPPAGGLSVSFSTPPSGRVIAGSVLVSVTASPGVVGVQFKVDGQNLGNEITVAPFSVTWNTTLTSNSVHTLTAVARDAVGNQATATETITVDNTLAAAPPAGGLSVSFSTPPSERVIAGSVLVSVTASPGVVGVQFKVDGQNLGNEITVAPFSEMWNTTLTSNSVHTLTAVARDAVGNQATATETITVDNTLAAAPPAGGLSVSFSTPPSGRVIAGSVLVSVTASPGVVRVQFKVDGQNLGAEVTTLPYSTVWNTTSASNASHTVTAEARDSAGNVGVAATTVTVDNSLPAFPPGVAPLTFSFSAAKSWMSSDTSDQPQVGFGRIRGSSSVTPSGATIISFRQNGVLVSQAGIPASLPMRSGRCYVEFNGQVNTGLAIGNPNNQDAIVSFYFTDSAGNNFGSNTFTVTANHQIVAFVNQNPFNGTAVAQGTLTFTSNVPVSIAALRILLNERDDFIVSALSFADLQGQNSTDPVVVPHFVDGGGWRTQIVLVNPGDVPLSGNVQFFGQGQTGSIAPLLTLSANGVSNSTFPYTVAPRSFVRMTTSGAGNVQVGSVQVTPAQNNNAPSISTTFSFMNNGVTISESMVATVSPGLTFRTYVQSSGATNASGSVQTALAIANPSGGPVDANVELLTLDGVSMGLTTTVTIPSGGQIARFVRELFPQLNTSFEGVLRLKSTTPLVMTALREVINERGDSILTSTPPVNEASFTNPEMMFPLVVSGGGYNTQFVLLSVSSEATVSGNLWLISSAGAPLN